MASTAVHVPFGELYRSPSAPVWAERVAPLVAALEGFLPAGASVRVDAGSRHLAVSWPAGPPPFAAVSLVSDVLGKSSNAQWDDTWEWPGLTASFDRAVSSSALGFAVLSAALAGDCPRCSGSEAFAYSFDEAFGRPDPHLLASHPNLVALGTLGIPAERLVALADVVGGLCSDGRSSAERFYHERGHLAGLVELSASLVSA